MLVTGIERQKRHPDRVNLYLDGEFAFGLHQEVLLKAGLRKGDNLTPGDVEALKAREEFSLAKRKAHRLISYRMRSERELKSRLLAEEFDPATVDRVLEDLRNARLVDDAAFARAFVHDAQMRKPTGRRLLTQQLRLRGIAKEIVDETIGGRADPESEETLALAAARKYLRRSRPSGDARSRELLRGRTARFLERRGFDWAVIRSVLRSLFRSSSADD